jgi:hypothetical protein
VFLPERQGCLPQAVRSPFEFATAALSQAPRIFQHESQIPLPKTQSAFIGAHNETLSVVCRKKDFRSTLDL